MQVVSLIASYLEVPLRYPLRLGASRSYINDYAPSTEPTSSDLSPNTTPSTNTKAVEFPLFLEGQDTRAAYAVFLLNKVFCLFIQINIKYEALLEDNVFGCSAVTFKVVKYTLLF